MNALPAQIPQPSASGPAFPSRSPSRAEPGEDSFDRVLSGAEQEERAPTNISDREPVDESPTEADAPADETEHRAEESGILPLLQIVAADDKARTGPGTGPAAAASAVEGSTRNAGNKDTPKPAAAERPATPAEMTDARVVDAPVETDPQSGPSRADNASLSLLSKLNQMNAPAEQGAVTRLAETAQDGEPPAQSADEPASTDRQSSRQVAAGPGGNRSDDGQAGGRERGDAIARTVEASGSDRIAAATPTGQQTSAAAQVVEALAPSANSVAQARAVAASAQRDAAAAESVQSLKIQLKPHELGQVTANMTMDGDRLSIEIEVDTLEAHRRLSTESDAIIKALRAHGIVVDQVTIQQPSQPAATGNDPNGGQGAAFAGRDTRDSSGNPDGRNHAQSSSDHEHVQDTRSGGESPAPRARNGSGVYI